MAVSIGGIGELQRHERPLWPVEPSPVFQQRLQQRRSDERRKEFAKDDGLIIPSQFPRGSFKDRLVRHAAGPSAIDTGVVRVHERQMHLRHERMQIVPRITDDRRALGVAEG